MGEEHSKITGNDLCRRLEDDETGPPNFRHCAEDVHAQMEKAGFKGRLRFLEATTTQSANTHRLLLDK